MFNINNYEYDCTKKCKYREHGRQITATSTRRSIPDDKLASYIAKVCKNFAEILDFEGRTALHLAASTDRYVICEWLINHGANVNAKDVESGNSALHRSIFYGCINCAVLLLRYGANIEMTDYDFRNPLQYICKASELEFNAPQNNDLLAWGANKNYNLGIENTQNSSAPQLVDFFRKQNIMIQSLSLSSFHSMFLDQKGQVYAVGHGKGGRLGIGAENSLATPKRVRLPAKHAEDKAVAISCSKNHSLVLTRHSVTNFTSVFACGLNDDQQLGIDPPPEKLTSFKEICAFSQYGVEDLIGIIARDSHSVAWNQKDIYVWGRNNGQFSLKKDITFVTLPHLITLPAKQIRLVESNNLAIVCYTSDKLLFIFYNYKLKVAKTPTLEALSSISVVGGDTGLKSNRKSEENVLRILVLTVTNCLYIWFDDTQQFIRCSFTATRYLQIDKILFKTNRLLLLSCGDLYSGTATKCIIQNAIDMGEFKETYNKKDICTNTRMKIELKRIPNIDRAVDIFCDDDFQSFATLEESSRKYFLIPKLAAEEYTFKTLLHDASEFDAIHDVIFHVDNEIFAAHKFIIFSRSKGLMKTIQETDDKKIFLNFHFLTAKMFELILKWIYYLDDILKSLGPDGKDEKTALKLFLRFVDKFELYDVANFLRSSRGSLDGVAAKQKSRFTRLKNTAFPQLYDLTIRCAGDREIRVHKCVLVARLEYFNLMLNNSWSETKTINLTTIPLEYMDPIINFLYTGDVDYFRKQKYSESFLYNMIVICDQFFINQLRKLCEILLLERISVRRICEMLEFACEYHCEILERSCLEYICYNLARILEQRILEHCDSAVLSKINQFYRQIFKNKLDFRVITPHIDGDTEDTVTKFTSDFTTNLDYKMSETDKTKGKNKSKISKAIQDRKSYEQEAISSMKEHSVEMTPVKAEKNSEVSEIEKISNEFDTMSRTWIKVQDKKENQKRFPMMAAVNEIMKLDVKDSQKLEMTNLNDFLKTPPKIVTAAKSITPDDSLARSNISLGDFTPLKAEKLSQKQRKRFPSETKLLDPSTSVSSKPIAIPDQKPNNAWGIVQSPENSFSFESMKFSSPEKSSRSFDKFSSPSFEIGESNFSKILADERRQKDYFEKIKSKSLILTQIEEKAIDELMEFYNVENIDDEKITISRRNIQATLNFAVWTHK